MLTEISPYSSLIPIRVLERRSLDGYFANLNSWLWRTARAETWITTYGRSISEVGVVYAVDVLPPANIPGQYRKPVFIAETRYEFFNKFELFGRSELLQLLFLAISEGKEYLRRSPHDNIFLLENGLMAVVQQLPAYQTWQLHIVEDWPFMINPGTRFFMIQRGTV